MFKRIIIIAITCCLLVIGIFSKLLADDANPKEFGAIWQKSYRSATPHPCPFNNLNTTDFFCTALRTVLENKGKWTVNTGVWHGDVATANDVESGGQDKADWVDLFVWTGHGPSAAAYWPDGGNLHFVTNHSQNTAPDYCNATADAGNVSHDECSWGQGDCEVVIVFTCSFLSDRGDPAILRRIKKMCQGVHVICGFSSVMTVNRDQGTTLGKYLMGQAGWFVRDITPRTIISSMV